LKLEFIETATPNSRIQSTALSHLQLGANHRAILTHFSLGAKIPPAPAWEAPKPEPTPTAEVSENVTRYGSLETLFWISSSLYSNLIFNSNRISFTSGGYCW